MGTGRKFNVGNVSPKSWIRLVKVFKRRVCGILSLVSLPRSSLWFYREMSFLLRR